MCWKRFQSKKDLGQHLESQSDKRVYTCKYCDKAFRQKSSLGRHVKHAHGDKENPATSHLSNTLPDVPSTSMAVVANNLTANPDLLDSVARQSNTLEVCDSSNTFLTQSQRREWEDPLLTQSQPEMEAWPSNSEASCTDDNADR